MVHRAMFLLLKQNQWFACASQDRCSKKYTQKLLCQSLCNKVALKLPNRYSLIVWSIKHRAEMSGEIFNARLGQFRK